MKHRTFVIEMLAVACLLLQGCTVTFHVREEPRSSRREVTLERLNRRAAHHTAYVERHRRGPDGARLRFQAQSMQIGPDSTAWRARGGGPWHHLATDDVFAVSLRRRATAEGFFIGLLSSLPVGVATAHIAASTIPDDAGYEALGAYFGSIFLGAITAAVTVAAGTVIGATSHSTTRYVVNPLPPPMQEVVMRTSLGDVVLVVYQRQAPVTAANFLRYVDEHRFDGASFYRTVRMDNQPDDSVRIEVIQGGLGFKANAQRLPPIPHETTKTTGLHHVDGTVSMARAAPGSASSEFFICIGDQPALDYGGKRNPDGQGFAAFGQVIEGMAVVRAIHQKAADGQMLVASVRILSMERVR